MCKKEINFFCWNPWRIYPSGTCHELRSWPGTSCLIFGQMNQIHYIASHNKKAPRWSFLIMVTPWRIGLQFTGWEPVVLATRRWGHCRRTSRLYLKRLGLSNSGLKARFKLLKLWLEHELEILVTKFELYFS